MRVVGVAKIVRTDRGTSFFFWAEVEEEGFFFSWFIFLFSFFFREVDLFYSLILFIIPTFLFLRCLNISVNLPDPDTHNKPLFCFSLPP